MRTYTTRRRGLRLTTILTVVMSLFPTHLAAQGGQTATLLRRLAEAIDGNHTGAPVFIVAETRFPNRVLGAYPNRDGADSLSRVTGGSAAVFGPFDTDPPGVRPGSAPNPGSAMRLGPGSIAACRHDRRTSAMDTVPNYCAMPKVPVADVLTMTLQLQLRNGRTISAPIPLSTDVVFLQMEAVEKFAIPYYSKVVGLDEALRMRGAFEAFYRR